jgi:hypothetical protein
MRAISSAQLRSLAALKSIVFEPTSQKAATACIQAAEVIHYQNIPPTTASTPATSPFVPQFWSIVVAQYSSSAAQTSSGGAHAQPQQQELRQTCWNCGAESQQDIDPFFCHACEALQELPPNVNYYALLGM